MQKKSEKRCNKAIDKPFADTDLTYRTEQKTDKCAESGFYSLSDMASSQQQFTRYRFDERADQNAPRRKEENTR